MYHSVQRSKLVHQTLIVEMGCSVLGYTPDKNGAQPGGVSTVFHCPDGKYRVRYGKYKIKE